MRSKTFSEANQKDAANLVRDLASGIRRNSPSKTMSSSVYDTAWVSMVSKKHGQGRRWLFPDAFRYILNEQCPDGSWKGGATDIDVILNTASALLALLQHRRYKDCAIESETGEPRDLQLRIEKATNFLKFTLDRWDFTNTDQVGFELLVPALLKQLGTHEISFSFPAQEALFRERDKKLSKLRPEMLYSSKRSTLVHSLEAFVGIADFNRVEHHLSNGSMMNSPSATAAFLINSTTWNEEAENYLHRAKKINEQKNFEGFPTAFPTEIFDINWCLSTLLEAGFTADELDAESVSVLADYLTGSLSEGNGTIGFASQILPDADDTAKAFQALYCLGKTSVDVNPMIDAFESEGCFRTYSLERNPSFSANCNVLKALLSDPNPKRYTQRISTTISYLCKTWMSQPLVDKWNTVPEYCIMLLSEALVKALRLWDNDTFSGLDVQMIDEVPSVLAQALSTVLSRQNSDGCWGDGSSEITAYAILALTNLASIPVTGIALEQACTDAIARGREFLLDSKPLWKRPRAVWIEKVTYSSPLLCQTYCLAALKASIDTASWSKATEQLTVETVKKFIGFFSSLPLFSDLQDKELILRCALAESSAYSRSLHRVKRSIFPRKQMQPDKYLEYIPLTWTASRIIGPSSKVTGDVLEEMMRISMLNYQVDEYMETALHEKFGHDIDSARALVRRICCSADSRGTCRTVGNTAMVSKVHCNGRSPDVSQENPAVNGTGQLQEIEQVLSSYVNRITSHTRVLAAPTSVQARLRLELDSFFQAHITQIEDNMKISSQKQAFSSSQQSSVGPQTHQYHPQKSFFDWVHTTGADHTSCPFSLIYFCCLINGHSCFQNARLEFLMRDLCRHLASSCRMYNDYGSLTRDCLEMNLNSLDFGEFALDRASNDDSVNEATRKEDLLWLAGYESEGVRRTMRSLEEEGIDESILAALKLFINVTDLYGQIYIARDIAARMR
ncbi:MAG: hypothetical protein M1820_009475 [Bogoriella megaspora]|nr:MAG: hypothetical protein M1820_009475 [Bogoriella megaspora]